MKVSDGRGHYAPLTFKQKDTRRIALIHGNVSPDDRNRILETFNSEDNKRGQLINIIVLSPASTEGINLFCVRHVHILEPQWATVLLNQAIARAVRRKSHIRLPENERDVVPHLYLSYVDSVLDSIPQSQGQRLDNPTLYSTDQLIYTKSLAKFAINKQFTFSLSMAAFNCCDYVNVTFQRLKEYYDLEI